MVFSDIWNSFSDIGNILYLKWFSNSWFQILANELQILENEFQVLKDTGFFHIDWDSDSVFTLFFFFFHTIKWSIIHRLQLYILLKDKANCPVGNMVNKHDPPDGSSYSRRESDEPMGAPHICGTSRSSLPSLTESMDSSISVFLRLFQDHANNW